MHVLYRVYEELYVQWQYGAIRVRYLEITCNKFSPKTYICQKHFSEETPAVIQFS